MVRGVVDKYHFILLIWNNSSNIILNLFREWAIPAGQIELLQSFAEK